MQFLQVSVQLWIAHMAALWPGRQMTRDQGADTARDGRGSRGPSRPSGRREGRRRLQRGAAHGMEYYK